MVLLKTTAVRTSNSAEFVRALVCVLADPPYIVNVSVVSLFTKASMREGKSLQS
jgi:hypothetical protein